MSELQTLQDVVLAAHAKMGRPAWEFVVGGAESETTAKRNRRALDRLALQAEPFNDVSRIDITTKILGQAVAAPFFLAPMGSVSLFDAEGAKASAQAAAQAGVLTFISGVADPGIEQVCADGTGPLVYTLYVTRDKRWLDETLEKLSDLPLAGLALVADAPYYARRDRDLMSGVQSKVRRTRLYSDVQRAVRAGEVEAPELLDPSLNGAKVTWDLFAHIKRRTSLPLIIKGVMSGRVAVRALDSGADVIYVSNHGGRQLDHQLGTVDVLPSIVEQVGANIPVFVDGGCLHGADIIKCLSLGAEAVGIGRLQALALAAGGVSALVRALRILEEELVVDMGLLGVTSLTGLNADRLVEAEPIGPPHVLGGYPVVMEKLG